MGKSRIKDRQSEKVHDSKDIYLENNRSKNLLVVLDFGYQRKMLLSVFFTADQVQHIHEQTA